MRIRLADQSNAYVFGTSLFMLLVDTLLGMGMGLACGISMPRRFHMYYWGPVGWVTHSQAGVIQYGASGFFLGILFVGVYIGAIVIARNRKSNLTFTHELGGYPRKEST